MIHSVPVTINGEERKLAYGFRELRFIEERTGFSFLSGREGNIPRDSLSFFLVVLTAGLMRDGNPSLSDVEALLDAFSPEDYERVHKAISEALDANYPDAKEGDEERPQ